VVSSTTGADANSNTHWLAVVDAANAGRVVDVPDPKIAAAFAAFVSLPAIAIALPMPEFEVITTFPLDTDAVAPVRPASAVTAASAVSMFAVSAIV